MDWRNRIRPRPALIQGPGKKLNFVHVKSLELHYGVVWHVTIVLNVAPAHICHLKLGQAKGKMKLYPVLCLLICIFQLSVGNWDSMRLLLEESRIYNPLLSDICCYHLVLEIDPLDHEKEKGRLTTSTFRLLPYLQYHPLPIMLLFPYL